VRNKIDHSLPPDALFLNPWQDEGIKLLLEPEFIWRSMPAGVIEGFSLSAHSEIDQKTKKFLMATKRQRVFANAIEYASVPIVVQHAEFRKSQFLRNGRVLLNGAAGTRAINQHRATCNLAKVNFDDELNAYFEGCRAGNKQRELAVYTGFLDTDLHFAVVCRNTFNYFHFITESLSQLTLLDGLDFQGSIYFHYPNSDEKHRAFAEEFVAALFPEYQGRVFFERVPKDYERVITGFDILGAAEQAPEHMFTGLSKHTSKYVVEKGGLANIGLKQIFAMNGASSAVLALRARGLAALEGQDFGHLPKRFYVGRTINHSRPRAMAGQDLLFEHLQLFGFEYIMFEMLSPLEQIAIMAQAEVVVSCHGAGFTNMLFANPDAYVIELGTLQTAQFRWGDFWPLAHASQCRYVTFFCDFKSQNQTIEPLFRRDGIVPVAMSGEAIAHVMAFIVSVLGQYPTLKSSEMIAELSRQLVTVGAAEHAVGLLNAHPGIAQGNMDLCLILADAYKKLDDTKFELLALDHAYKANPLRWQTLVRIIWCANRCERPQVIRWALSRLELDFPERHAAFVSNHEWLQFVA
jgi:hypothetical protein